ncbi:GH25 family lysozyme, partial [Anaerotruncus colihominis]
MNIKGIDISSHQGEIDFERVKADGVRFVIIKAGQGLREM